MSCLFSHGRATIGGRPTRSARHLGRSPERWQNSGESLFEPARLCTVLCAEVEPSGEGCPPGIALVTQTEHRWDWHSRHTELRIREWDRNGTEAEPGGLHPWLVAARQFLGLVGGLVQDSWLRHRGPRLARRPGHG